MGTHNLGQTGQECDAPSVLMPESVNPSAGACCASLQSFMLLAVLVPESFRGGCSFGVGRTDLSRKGISMALVCSFPKVNNIITLAMSRAFVITNLRRVLMNRTAMTPRRSDAMMPTYRQIPGPDSLLSPEI